MRSFIFLAIPLLIAPLASAQVIIPNSYATVEGVTNNSWPYNFSNGAGHYQQTYDGTQFPSAMTITEIAYRYRGDTATPGGVVDMTMTLAQCATPWSAPSATFASNIGANPTVVFNGQWTIPPFSGDPATPNPFTARLVLTTPFNYDPALGDLLLDVDIRTAAGNSSGAFSRAPSGVGVYRVYDNSGTPGGTSGVLSNVALITEFTGPTCNGSVVFGGAGCMDSSGTQLAMAYSGCPDLSATLDIKCVTGASVTAPVLYVMGLSDTIWASLVLPLDLTLFGATGCSLYTSQEIILGPVPNPGGGSTLSIPIANNPTFQGVVTYWQCVVIDPGSNPLGLATSDYATITIQ